MGSMLPPLIHLPVADVTDQAEHPSVFSKDSTSESFSTQQPGMPSPIRVGKWFETYLLAPE